ncbi:CHAP domain-containing protein [Candidatus Parcubacteria bacterium]|nr:CHAP domain-containing protein [Candidatus Parcubacteria bacterium]
MTVTTLNLLQAPSRVLPGRFDTRKRGLPRDWQLYSLFWVTLLCGLISLSWQSPGLAVPGSSTPLTVEAPAANPLLTTKAARETPLAKPAKPAPTPAPAAAKPAAAPVVPTVVTHPAGSLRNGYPFGQCTYYVATRRAVPKWGNARSWYANAQRAGYQVGAAPRVGAIAWTPAGAYGHVAYVEAVNGSQVTVAEMNYAGWGRIGRRTVPASAFRYIY